MNSFDLKMANFRGFSLPWIEPPNTQETPEQYAAFIYEAYENTGRTPPPHITIPIRIQPDEFPTPQPQEEDDEPPPLEPQRAQHILEHIEQEYPSVLRLTPWKLPYTSNDGSGLSEV